MEYLQNLPFLGPGHVSLPARRQVRDVRHVSVTRGELDEVVGCSTRHLG